MIIGKRFYFDAAHHLPNYQGKCRVTHGHTYTLEVEVYGAISIEESTSEEGMVLDLNTLSGIVKDILIQFDHQDLNTIIEPPTCERLIVLLKAFIEEALPESILLYSLRLQEGEGGWARC